jgi:hypothetical protein
MLNYLVISSVMLPAIILNAPMMQMTACVQIQAAILPSFQIATVIRNVIILNANLMAMTVNV